MLNGYIAFYNGRQTEVHAATAYEAQKAAVIFFKPPKSKQHLVHVVLAEKNGEQVAHSTASL